MSGKTKIKLPAPLENIEWRDPQKLDANLYNPNVVLTREMELLKLSIEVTGWIQPILISPKGIIIDGFHRTTIARLNNWMVPCCVLNLDEKERMLLTVRINRAELLDEISTDDALRYIADGGYWMQIKYDGHRCQVEKRADGTVVRYAKLGHSSALPSEVAEELKLIPLDTFFMDGELVGDSFVAFELLSADGVDLRDKRYQERFDQLVGALAYRGRNFIQPAETWRFTGEKRRGFDACQVQHCEGVVFKKANAPYRGGESRQHLKVKFTKTASCKVVAVGVNSKANAAVALLDGTKWVEVAHVSTIGKGKISVGDVVEVEFLCATEGRRLREPRIKEVRNDEVGASECTMDQLKNAYRKEAA